MMAVNGWTLLVHPVFVDQVRKLTAAVEQAQVRDPAGWQQSSNAKLLVALREIVFTRIPQDPTRAEYRQGNTLGTSHKHWFRAKFGAGRFRVFFRYDTRSKIIVFAWVNDAHTLRTYGAKTDAYAVFRRMLDAGTPPDDWAALLSAAHPP
jgi:toxin YhaV